MSSKTDLFIKNVLGDDFYESLEKVELWKPGTKSTLDHEEIRTALQIVPRTILSLLYSQLSSMKLGESKEIPLMVGTDAHLKVNKHERDVYSGYIRENSKVLVEFKFRSIPGIGLIVMSCFELYDMDNLINSPTPTAPSINDPEEKVQKIIDERMALHSLVELVVEKKLSQRDAIEQLIMAKLTEAIKLDKKKDEIVQAAMMVTPTSDHCPIAEVIEKSSESKEKGSPLKSFLSKRESKKKPKEFVVHMAKGESVHCPDCGKNIYNGDLFSGCICYGDDMDRKVWIKKSEDGDVKIRFSSGWDPENIEMLLEVMRSKNKN